MTDTGMWYGMSACLSCNSLQNRDGLELENSWWIMPCCRPLTLSYISTKALTIREQRGLLNRGVVGLGRGRRRRVREKGWGLGHLFLIRVNKMDQMKCTDWWDKHAAEGDLFNEEYKRKQLRPLPPHPHLFPHANIFSCLLPTPLLLSAALWLFLSRQSATVLLPLRAPPVSTPPHPHLYFIPTRPHARRILCTVRAPQSVHHNRLAAGMRSFAQFWCNWRL